jgi:N-acetylneuraminic acid mutarotase
MDLLCHDVICEISHYLTLQDLSQLSKTNKSLNDNIRTIIPSKLPYMIKQQKLLPDRWSSSASTIWKDRMYVLGGHTIIKDTQMFDVVSSNIYYYDFTHQTWNKAAMPYQISEHTCVVHHDTLYIFGGTGGSGGQYLNEVFSFDIISGVWKLVSCSGDIPHGRSSHCAGVYNNKMYVYGGWAGFSSFFNDIYALDLTTFIWRKINPKNNASSTATNCSSVIYKDTFYLFGGTDGKTWGSDLWIFDLIKETWEKKCSPMSPRSRTKMVEWNGSLYIIGGWDRQTYFSDIYRFDIETSLWTLLPSLSVNTNKPAVNVYQNSIYMYGGFDFITKTETNEFSRIVLNIPHSQISAS